LVFAALFLVADLANLAWLGSPLWSASGAVARALASLSAKGGEIPGASWAAPLCIIGPRSGHAGSMGPGRAKRSSGG